MNQKERMLAGLLYNPFKDNLDKERLKTQALVFEYNNCNPSQTQKREELIKSIIGKTGERLWVEQPFRCDYGFHIEVGEDFYSNYNFTVLDCAKVTIGDHVMIAPNVSIYTAGHPIHPDNRNSGYEYGIEVTIGDNVWIGGNSIINPGVHIGNNVVIGSGSVVTHDIPDNHIAAGNPAKILREITEEDRNYYYKKRLFIVE